jgi:hypothetical protein
MPQSRSTFTLTQTAERLSVRPAYVHQLVAKKRLKLLEGDLFEQVEVERLADLMDKLRGKGIAALVQISGKEG